MSKLPQKYQFPTTNVNASSRLISSFPKTLRKHQNQTVPLSISSKCTIFLNKPSTNPNQFVWTSHKNRFLHRPSAFFVLSQFFFPLLLIFFNFLLNKKNGQFGGQKRLPQKVLVTGRNRQEEEEKEVEETRSWVRFSGWIWREFDGTWGFGSNLIGFGLKWVSL